MKLKQSKIKLLWLLAGWQKDYAMVAVLRLTACHAPRLSALFSNP